MKTDNLEIIEIVKNNRIVADRIKQLSDKGYQIVTRSMGTGGVLQEKRGRKCTYVQIGYGVGKYNYASAVKIPL
jgi:hypothetical protein